LGKHRRLGMLVVLTAAALAAPIALAGDPPNATSFATVPAESPVNDDAIVRTAQSDSVPKPRLLPPNPCRKLFYCSYTTTIIYAGKRRTINRTCAASTDSRQGSRCTCHVKGRALAGRVQVVNRCIRPA
jgi:hypothetical protein